MLSCPHLSKPRSPLIAEVFYLSGAVKIWGRGTNRVIKVSSNASARTKADSGW